MAEEMGGRLKRQAKAIENFFIAGGGLIAPKVLIRATSPPR